MTNDEYLKAIDQVFYNTRLKSGASDFNDEEFAQIPEALKQILTDRCNSAWGEGATIRPDRMDSEGGMVDIPEEDPYLSRKPTREDVVAMSLCKYIARTSGNEYKWFLIEASITRFYLDWPD